MAIQNPIQNGSNVSNSFVYSATSFFTDLAKSVLGKAPQEGTPIPTFPTFDKSQQAIAFLNSAQSVGSALLHRAQLFAEQAGQVVSLSSQLVVQNIRREIALSQLPPEVRKAFENRMGIDRLSVAIQTTENRIKLLNYLAKDTQLSFTQKENILQILVGDLALTQQDILKEEAEIAPEFQDSGYLQGLGENETVYPEKVYTEVSKERYDNEDKVGTLGEDLALPGDFVHERENSYVTQIKSDAEVLNYKREEEHYNYSGLTDQLHQWASNQKHAQVMQLKMRVVGELKSAGLENLPENDVLELYARLNSYGDHLSSAQVQSELDRVNLRLPIKTQIEITHQMAQKLFENGERVEGFAELEAGFSKAKALYEEGKYSEAKAVFVENYKNPLREKLALRFKEVVAAEIEKNKVSYYISLTLITAAATAATVLTDGLGASLALRGMQWGMGEFFCNATLFYASHEVLTMGYEYLSGRDVQVKDLKEHGVDLLFNYGMFGALGKSMSAFQNSVKESLALKYLEKTGRTLTDLEKDLLFARYVSQSGLKEKMAYYSKQFTREYTTLLGWNVFETTARGTLEGHFDPLSALAQSLNPENLADQTLFLIGLKMGSWAARPVTRFANSELEWAILGEERGAQLRDLGKALEKLQSEYMEYLGKAEVDSALLDSPTHHDLLARYQSLLEARQRVLTTLPADLIREGEVEELKGDISAMEARNLDPYSLVQSLKDPFSQSMTPSGLAGAYDLVDKAFHNYLLTRTWNAKEILAVKMEAFRLGRQEGKFQDVSDASELGLHQAVAVVREKVSALRGFISRNPKAIPDHYPLYEKIREMERLQQGENSSKTGALSVSAKPLEVQSTLSWSKIADLIHSGRDLSSLAKEVNGTEVTAGVNNMELARKVVSIAFDTQEALKHPEVQAQRKVLLMQKIRAAVTKMSTASLEVRDFVQLLSPPEMGAGNFSDAAYFLRSAYESRQVKIRILPEAEYDRVVKELTEHEPHHVRGVYVSDTAGYKNTILIRQMPELDLRDSKSRDRAMSEIYMRLETLIHEGEHWRHTDGPTKPGPFSTEAERSTVHEMMAFLEQARWRTLNFDSDYINKANNSDKNLARFFKAYIDEHYLGLKP